MKKDLALLVADKNMEGALRGLLSRPKSLGLREIAFDLFVHPERDHGCLLRSHHFLRPFSHQYSHALVLLDRDGCGQESVDRAALERQVEGHLSASGWADRAAAIVIDPELEIWVWSDSPHIATALGWATDGPSLRKWLAQKGWVSPGQTKPTDPKTAVEEALRLSHRPRSSSLYFQLAQKVSFDRCVDASFLKLRNTLSGWFPKPV